MARERRVNGRRDVAVVGLRNEHGEVLMIETSRLPGKWQPVGGGVDPEDETPLHAAVREAKEELDVELRTTDLNWVANVPYDFGVGTVHFYWATLPPGTPLQFNRREIQNHRWLPVEQALKLPTFPATRQFLKDLQKALEQRV